MIHSICLRLIILFLTFSCFLFDSAFADCNNDGLMDLLYRSSTANGSPDPGLFINLGDGKYARSSNITVSSSTYNHYGADWGGTQHMI